MQKFLAFFLLMALAACDVQPSATAEFVTEVPAQTESQTVLDAPLESFELPAGYGATNGSWLDIYFTNPSSPLSAQETGGIDGPLAEAIDSAQLSVDVAIYSLSLNSIRDALLDAQDRGVVVRMVMESDNMDRTDAQILKDAGIPMLGDRREGLMHNKFVVIDNSEVWLGSMNFTDSGAYQDNNHLVRIRSVKMAENYTKEFEEMFVDDKFGDRIEKATPHPRVTIDGTPIDVYFSPDDGVQASFVELVENAEDSIYFFAFSFTSDEIGEAARARAQDGVIVKGVMDDEQVNSNVGTEFDPFQQAGLDVFRDGNENGQMHHKVMVIDRSIVVLGSYNFTNSAETRNDENLIVIYNKQVALQFFNEFQRVFSEAQ